MTGNETLITYTVTCASCGLTMSEQGRNPRKDFPDYRGWVYVSATSGKRERYHICSRCAEPPSNHTT